MLAQSQLAVSNLISRLTSPSRHGNWMGMFLFSSLRQTCFSRPDVSLLTGAEVRCYFQHLVGQICNFSSTSGNQSVRAGGSGEMLVQLVPGWHCVLVTRHSQTWLAQLQRMRSTLLMCLLVVVICCSVAARSEILFSFTSP